MSHTHEQSLSDPHTFDSFGRAVIAQAIQQARAQVRDGAVLEDGKIEVGDARVVVHFEEGGDTERAKADICCVWYCTSDGVCIGRGSCCQ